MSEKTSQPSQRIAQRAFHRARQAQRSRLQRGFIGSVKQNKKSRQVQVEEEPPSAPAVVPERQRADLLLDRDGLRDPTHVIGDVIHTW